MKLGVITTSADCVALLRQLLPGYDCSIYADSAGLAEARERELDVLVIDLDAIAGQALAAETGVQALAPQGSRPAILLLAQASQKALLHALRAAGAADFLLKPIRRNELALRLDLLLHDGAPAGPSRLVEAEGFVVDLDTLHASHAARPGWHATLTQKEADLALLLLSHLGRPLSRAFIQERIWGAEPELPTRTIDTHVSRVRSKLMLKPGQGYRLATVYGYGYQLERLDG